METKTPDLKNKLLVAIRAAVQRQADATASMQEWERPAPDSAYWKTRLVAGFLFLVNPICRMGEVMLAFGLC